MSRRENRSACVFAGALVIGGGCLAIAGLGQYGMRRLNEKVAGMYDSRVLPLEELGGFKASLYRTRALLLTMLNEKDPGKQRQLHEQIRESSRQVDSAVARGLSANGFGMKEKELFKSFATVWNEFKTVRETELIPAYRRGGRKEAADLALGAQAKRFERMTMYLNDLIKMLGAEAAADRDEAKRWTSMVAWLLWALASSCCALLIFICVQIDRLILKSQ